jgi:hypothetical protein
MTQPTALRPAQRVGSPGTDAAVWGAVDQWSERQVAVLRSTIARDLTRDEMYLLAQVAVANGADPFQSEVVPVIYNKGDAAKRSLSFIFSTQWATKKANSTGDMASIGEAEFMDAAGHWWPVWIDEQAEPVAARVISQRVIRNGDGSVAQLVDETTIIKMSTAKSWGIKDSPFWEKDPVYMLGMTCKRHAVKKFLKAPAVAGHEASIGQPGVDYQIIDGQALFIIH